MCGYTDDQLAEMQALTTLERASDDLLRRHGLLKAGECMTERELVRRTAREISSGVDIPWTEDALIPERPRVSLGELLQHCTPRQRRYCRAMMRLGKQVLVAQEVGVQPSAVSRTLGRAYLRIMAVYRVEAEREPSPEAYRLFGEEIRLKLRLVYRRPTTHLGWHEIDHRGHRRRGN
jgi:hypothetical protein